jgi:hypothetical protein
LQRKNIVILPSPLRRDAHCTFTAIKESDYLRVVRTIAGMDYHIYCARRERRWVVSAFPLAGKVAASAVGWGWW